MWTFCARAPGDSGADGRREHDEPQGRRVENDVEEEEDAEILDGDLVPITLASEDEDSADDPLNRCS